VFLYSRILEVNLEDVTRILEVNLEDVTRILEVNLECNKDPQG
jgi:hypothetical protein